MKVRLIQEGRVLSKAILEEKAYLRKTLNR